VLTFLSDADAARLRREVKTLRNNLAGSMKRKDADAERASLDTYRLAFPQEFTVVTCADYAMPKHYAVQARNETQARRIADAMRSNAHLSPTPTHALNAYACAEMLTRRYEKERDAAAERHAARIRTKILADAERRVSGA